MKLWRSPGTELRCLRGHSTAVFDVAFSPDGRWMATAGGDATVRLWYPDGRLRTTFYAHNNGVLHLGFSRDGRTLASASEDKTAILWDLGRLLDPDRIVACACDRVRDYLKTNPEVPEERRNLCDSLRSSRVVRPQSV